MKRYFVFSGGQCYPSPGIYDLVADVDTIEEAKAFLREDDDFDWAHIFDTHENKIVFETGFSLYTEYGDNL